MLAHVQYARKPSSKNLAWKLSLQVEEMGDLVVTKHRRVHSKTGDSGTNEEVQDMTLKHMHDVGHSSVADRCGNGEGNHFSLSDLAKSCADVDTLGTNTDGQSELNRQGSTFDKISDIHKADGLQELLHLAREFESKEALQGGLDNGSLLRNEGFTEGCSPEQKGDLSLSSKEVGSKHKEVVEVSFPEEARLTNGVTERAAAATCSMSDAKSAPQDDDENLRNREELNCGRARASVNRKSSRSASFASITVGPSRSQFTIPQPFSLATEKRASGGGRPGDAKAGPSQKALGSNGMSGEISPKTPEMSRKLNSRFHVARSIRSESIKYQEDTFKKLTIRDMPGPQDEDAMSITSIQSCSLAPKAKASRFTSTSSFKFQTDARAEKRKEYYAKLQERMIAKEEEINQMHERAKKEREDEIKQLRRSLTYKAHPVPSFYRDGPPQKAELPKLPTTRAKSPNFSRRESHFGGSTRLCNLAKCEADHRSSLSPQKPGKVNSSMDLRGSDNYSKKSVEGKPQSQSPETRIAEDNTLLSGSASELLDVEVCMAESLSAEVQAKVRDPLIVSSDLMMSDEEEKVYLVQMVRSKPVLSNGGHEVYHDDLNAMNSGKTSPAVLDSCARPDRQVRANKVLQGQVNANAGVLSSSSNMTKTDKRAQPLVQEDTGDVCAGEEKQSTRKPRYKALTPYFRKGQSTNIEGQPVANKEMPHVNSDMTVGYE